MQDASELLRQFTVVFGDHGGDHYPGNVGVSRTACTICQEFLKPEDPVLFDYFTAWDQRPEEERKPLGVELRLVRNGQWEGAWALAQLHYDQLLKQEYKTKGRLHKGHPLCGLAIVAREIGSPTLTRHYALLSSAGDIYWEQQIPELRFGGFGPTMLEQFESYSQQHAWRESIRQTLDNLSKDKPCFLESFLAARWFSETYARHILDLADLQKGKGKPFVEVLLDSVENPGGASDTATGTRFEAAAGLLLSATPGFEVDSARKASDEQVDLVVRFTPERLTQLGLEPGCGLVECKSSKDPVTSSELRDFGAKCQFHRVRFGILFARAGTSGGQSIFANAAHAELVRRRFQLDGLTILVVSMDDIRGKYRDLRGLLDAISADYKLLVFGPPA